MHAFRLKYANPEDVATAVALLGIEARVAPLQQNGEAPDNASHQRRFVFVIGTEEAIREIAEIIEGMDIKPKETDAGV